MQAEQGLEHVLLHKILQDLWVCLEGLQYN